MEEAEYRLNHFTQQVKILREQVIESEMQVKNEEKIIKKRRALGNQNPFIIAPSFLGAPPSSSGL